MRTRSCDLGGLPGITIFREADNGLPQSSHRSAARERTLPLVFRGIFGLGFIVSRRPSLLFENALSRYTPVCLARGSQRQPTPHRDRVRAQAPLRIGPFGFDFTGHARRSMVNDEQPCTPSSTSAPNFLPDRSRSHGARNRKILRMPRVLAQLPKSVSRIVDRPLRRGFNLDRNEFHIVDRVTPATAEDDHHVGRLPPRPRGSSLTKIRRSRPYSSRKHCASGSRSSDS